MSTLESSRIRHTGYLNRLPEQQSEAVNTDHKRAGIIDEQAIIERLNDASNVRGFLITSVELFNESIDALIQRMFQQDNFAAHTVVKPLLHDSGPLGDLSVRLKLLFGLSAISDPVYHDIEDIIALRNMLNNDATDYGFSDKAIRTPVSQLLMVKKMGMIPQKTPIKEDMDTALFRLQQDREQQMIRSGLLLAIVAICNELGKDSPV